jgi:hypothetical protein
MHYRIQNTEYNFCKTHVHKITDVPVFYMVFGLNDFDWDKSITWAIEWPSKWIGPYKYHYVPRHINNRYTNCYTCFTGIQYNHQLLAVDNII